MKKRVLIMSTSAGSGHVRAAEALTKAFEEHPKVGEVVHSDALHFTNKLFRDFYSKLYTRLVQTAPEFLGWWYKQSDEPWKTDGMRLMLNRSNGHSTRFWIASYSSDVATFCRRARSWSG